ncbi:MAG: VOC family protein [Rickettsiales bacterium]
MVKAIPEGSHNVTPYMTCNDDARAIDFYKKAFGAVEIMRNIAPDGRITHAELAIGDSNLMLCDEFPEMGGKSAQTLGGSPVMIHLYTRDVDATVKKAVAAGAKLNGDVKDQFYGDRGGALTDPFGHKWWVATHIVDLSEDEIKRRAEKFWEEQEQVKKSA